MGGKQKGYSVDYKDYKLLEEIGYGASATVYRAMYIPFNEVVAVKCLDLDRCNSNLDDIRRETQTMRLVNHPNLINAHCSFVVDHNLWVVMPFMSEGSCLNIMESAYPDGFEESFIGPILKETLKALEYLHQQGHIHRDVKAGNILLHSTGEVKLADFGVSACMFDRGDRQGSRNTFVGTPCWMAPEVLQPGKGYDFNADIWSFGITALELAHGHAPFSKYPPMKVLLMTLQNAPPGLDYDRDKKFSKSFKEMVAMCLVKDQTKRPTCKKLLKHSFFKNTKPPELSIKKLFAGMPPLWKRVKSLQIKDEAQLALKGIPSSEQHALSQSEYQRGISAWNFDVEDLKLQASLLQEEEEIQEIEEEDRNVNTNAKDSSSLNAVLGKSFSKSGFSSGQIKANVLRAAEERQTKKVEILETDLTDSENQGNLGHRKDGSKADLPLSGLDKESLTTKTTTRIGKPRLTHSGPLAPGQAVGQLVSSSSLDSRFHIENLLPVERPPRVHKPQSSSGPLGLPRRASANSLSAPVKSSGGYGEQDHKAKASLVQIKGRFSIMSESLDLAKPLGRSVPPIDIGNSNIPSSVLMPGLQNLFQQTSIQQDLIVNLLNSLQSADAPDALPNGELSQVDPGSETNGKADGAVTERERALLQKISVLEARMTSLTDELKAEKLKYMQLQEQINTTSRLEVERHRT